MTKSPSSLAQPYPCSSLQKPGLWSYDSLNPLVTFVEKSREMDPVSHGFHINAERFHHANSGHFSFFEKKLFEEDCTAWSRSFHWSYGKRSLMEEDCGWNELEHALAQEHRNMQSEMTDAFSLSFSSVHRDSQGRREITAQAIFDEMEHFSGVVSLKTLMQLYTVDSMLRLAELYDSLRYFCKLVGDPQWGIMVLFKGMIYLQPRLLQMRPSNLFISSFSDDSPTVAGSKKKQETLVVATNAMLLAHARNLSEKLPPQRFGRGTTHSTNNAASKPHTDRANCPDRTDAAPAFRNYCNPTRTCLSVASPAEPHEASENVPPLTSTNKARTARANLAAPAVRPFFPRVNGSRTEPRPTVLAPRFMPDTLWKPSTCTAAR